MKTGDKVKILLGSYAWRRIGDTTENYDQRPELVGQEDIIEHKTETQGITQYSLVKNGAWFNESQLELISENSNL